jgi:hypothetical protein
MDLFMTPVSPSKKFDALTSEFPTELLTMALGGLSALVIFLKQYQQRSLLKRLWK